MNRRGFCRSAPMIDYHLRDLLERPNGHPALVEQSANKKNQLMHNDWFKWHVNIPRKAMMGQLRQRELHRTGLFPDILCGRHQLVEYKSLIIHYAMVEIEKLAYQQV